MATAKPMAEPESRAPWRKSWQIKGNQGKISENKYMATSRKPLANHASAKRRKSYGNKGEQSRKIMVTAFMSIL
jgi:hypothetical protein